MAERKSKTVFDTDGSILPCPTLQSREMAYGHVVTGIDFVAESQLLKRNLPDKCLNECELLPMCQGGCRLQALVKQGDFNGIDCNYALQRALLEDWMRQKAVEDRTERN
jgi:radical SAM protein with 4Fe4S-binding SPASM domain